MFKRTAVSLLCVVALGATAAPGAMAAKQVSKPGHPTAVVHHNGTVQAMQGGSTGTGPATDDDCEAIAAVINNRMSMAGDLLNSSNPKDVQAGATLIDEAANYENQGYNAGCFFVY